ncbi:MAG: hypothetical protein NXI10_02425 [bacterium]|nr:hypothetical protein [bacterium]
MEDILDIIVGIFSGNATTLRSVLVIVAGVLLIIFSPLGIVTWIFGAGLIVLGIVFLVISLFMDSNKKEK